MQEIIKKVKQGLELTEEEKTKLIQRVEKQDIRYGLVWEDHPEDVELLRETYSIVARELEELRIEAKEGQKPNLLLEGDNLHSLELLKDSGVKVDVIYIDPPYNTLNEKGFAYNDKMIDQNDIFRHSKWLSFMSKRLELARDLMTEDGVIFISIDDNEQAQLKLLCDSIFGERNFIANCIREVKAGSANDTRYLAIEYEYMLVYSKNKIEVEFAQENADVENKKYNKKDKYVGERGRYYLRDLQYKGVSNQPSKWKIELPNGEKVNSDFGGKKGHEWRWGEERFEWGLENGFIEFVKREQGYKVYIKQYQYVDNNNKPYKRTLPYKAQMQIMNSEGTMEINNLDLEFPYPKPTKLIKHVMEIQGGKGITVLDFFAGSGTTGQAVMELNKEDGGNRRFILCTNNEYQESKKVDIINNNTNIVIDTKKNGEPSVKGQAQLEEFESTQEYQDLVERGLFEEIGICRAITYERNKRVIQGYTTPKGKEIEGIPNNLSYYKVELEDTSEVDEFDLDDYNYGMQEVYLEIKEGTPKFEEKGYYSVSETENDVYIINKNDVFTSAIKEYVDKIEEEKTVYVYVTRELLNDYVLNELRERVEVREIKEKIKPKY